MRLLQLIPGGRILPLAATLALSGPLAAQDIPRLQQGDHVRFQVAGSLGRWEAGRLVDIERDSLFIDRAAGTAGYPLSHMTYLQLRSGADGAWALRGALIGTGISLFLMTSVVDSPGSSDGAFVAVVGGLVGAAMGSSRAARIAGGVGFAAGATAGALSLGLSKSACESGASDTCHFVIGSAFLGAVGLVVGSAMGMLLPNWRAVPADRVRLGVARVAPGRLGPTVTVHW